MLSRLHILIGFACLFSSVEISVKQNFKPVNICCRHDQIITGKRLGIQGFNINSVNKICHILNGNRNNLKGYKIAAWNCGRGLMSNNGIKSVKVTDIKLFIQNYNPGCFGIIESDIHGPNSTSNRTTTFTKDDILDQLQIQGYSIFLPDTWDYYSQARLVVFVREDLKVYKRQNPDYIRDLPSITLEVGHGRERKSLVNFYYREWTGGISGDSSQVAQLDRFTRQVDYWRNLKRENRDLILIGDANFCSLSCFNPEYPVNLKAISNLAYDFYLEETLTQLIDKPTRTESQGSNILKSCIDHITTSSPRKCINSEVVAGGNSDHLAIITTKLSRESINRPPRVKKRSYKYFSKENFLLEISNTDFREILSISDSDEAASMFEKIFGQILDNHAPVKIFQTRCNYAPWLSDKTKDDIKIRNELKHQSTISNDPEVLQKYKCLRNSIKARLKNEEETYYKDKFKESKFNVKNL